MANDDRVNFKCKSHDKQAWQEAADREGRSLSNWIQQVCNAAAMASEKEASKDDRKA